MATDTEAEETFWKKLEKEHLTPYKSSISAEMVEKINSNREVIRKLEGAGWLSHSLKSLFASTKFLLFYCRKLEKEIEQERKKRFDLLELYVTMALGRDRARQGSQIRYNLRRNY